MEPIRVSFGRVRLGELHFDRLDEDALKELLFVHMVSGFRPLEAVGADVKLPDLRPIVSYIRSKRPEPLILSPNPPMHGIYREVMRGLKALGFETVRADNPVAFLIESLRRPLFFLSINGTGILRNPALTSFLEHAGIPIVVWFVDHPMYLMRYKAILPKSAVILCWERTYIKDLKRMGYERTFYLPLATDPSIFHPRKVLKRFKVCFVGTSLMDPIRRVLRAVPRERKKVLSEARKGALALLKGEKPQWRGPKELFPFFEALSMWIASRIKRVELLRGLDGLTVFGDPDWRRLLPKAERRPPCLYYSELPEVFSASEVNVNINNLQLKTSVNQRVFDCPASGGFLITEWSEDLDELFDGEFPCFRSREELKERLNFYLKKPMERVKTVEELRKLVLSKHTYKHRASQILHIITSSA